MILTRPKVLTGLVTFSVAAAAMGMPAMAMGNPVSGISQTGISQNGISQNGISQNGISQNGISQNGILYPRVTWDAIIIYNLNIGNWSVYAINEQLHAEGLALIE